jgi:hypothetical protein
VDSGRGQDCITSFGGRAHPAGRVLNIRPL